MSKSAVKLPQVWWIPTVHKQNDTNKSRCCDFWKCSDPGFDEKSCIHFTVKMPLTRFVFAVISPRNNFIQSLYDTWDLEPCWCETALSHLV